MHIRPIRTDEDHDQALKVIETLWSSEPGSADADRLEVLATLADAYERTRWPTGVLDPIEALKAHMDMNGLVQKDLGALLGSQPRASEIMNRKRRLTLDHIRRIEAAWKLPAAYLVGDYELHIPKVSNATGRRRALLPLKAVS